MVIAFHVGIRGSSWAWVAVEVFFVLAGLRMAGVVERTATFSEYGRSRIRRMIPELGAVWCLLAVMTALGMRTPGGVWFLASSPLFLQHLTLPFFEYRFPTDLIFAPLWFVGALLQLQLLLFLCRGALLKRSAMTVAAAAFALGLGFRSIAALALGVHGGDISDRMGDVLYCLPLTHIEAIVLGFLVGRGSLQGLGRHLPALASVTIGASLFSAAFSEGHGRLFETFGLDFPLRGNYMFVWGYGLLALTAASLCSSSNPIAVRVCSIEVASSMDSRLSRLAAATYGVYVFHGPLLALLMYRAPWEWQHGQAPARFLAVTLVSFCLAQVALWVRTSLQQLHLADSWLLINRRFDRVHPRVSVDS